MTIDAMALPTTTHRALVMTPDNRMSLESRERLAPGAGEATLEVIATGICGSDIHGLAGDTGRRSTGQVMGHETVGRVVEVGPGVSADLIGLVATVNPVVGCAQCASCRAGETQQCEDLWVLGVRPDVDGAFAERVTVPAANVILLPDGMMPWHGAVVEPLAVGYHAVRRGEPLPTDRVLIIGGGPIGQAAALAARRFGVSHVLVSEPDTSRADMIRRLGVACAAPDRLGEAIEADLGGRATLVIDAVGNPRTLSAAFEHSRANARIVLVGMAAPELQFAAYQLSAKERSLIGTFCYSMSDFETTVSWLAEHPDVAHILVDRMERLDRGPAVFDDLLSGAAFPSKVLLAPRLEELT